MQALHAQNASYSAGPSVEQSPWLQQIDALTHDILAVEQEVETYKVQCQQLAVQEYAWRSAWREGSLDSLLIQQRDLCEKLMAARQDLNDTEEAFETAAQRSAMAGGEAQGELQAYELQATEARNRRTALRREVEEAMRSRARAMAEVQELSESRAALLRAQSERESRDAALVEDLPAQRARTQALLELAGARRAAAAARAEREGSEEALAEACRTLELQRKAACAGAAGARHIGGQPEAAAARWQEACERRDELLRRAATWRGLCAASRTRLEAAEGRAKRAWQRREAAEALAAKAEKQLEDAQHSATAALEAKGQALRALEGPRLQRQAAGAALAVAVAFLTGRVLSILGLTVA